MQARVLIACERCSRQYDVTHADAGARFDCACGAPLVARAPRRVGPRVLRCSNCGGKLRDGQRSCDYCAAEVTLEERRLSSVCPLCFARMAADARFCMECGVKIEPHPPEARAVGMDCPRCRAELRGRSLGETPALECGGCGGLWLEPRVFDRVCREAADPRLAAAGGLAGPADETAEVPEHPVAYLPCPVCEDLMVRRNFGGGSAVITDVCRQHGVWLDATELARIVRFLRAGGAGRRARGRGSSWSDAVELPRGALPASSGLDVERGPRSEWQRVLGFLGAGLAEILGL